MDHIDEHIISLLQENARMSLKDLAKEVFLSTPAVSARVEKLEKAGIITGYSAKINPLKLGFHITAFINMELDQFIGHLQKFGKTQTQIVFSTPVEPSSLNLEHMDDPQLGSELS